MSDLSRCPNCQKYIDTTLNVLVCPKCNADLSDKHLENEVFEASHKFPYKKPLLISILFFLGTFIFSYGIPEEFRCLFNIAMIVCAVWIYRDLIRQQENKK